MPDLPNRLKMEADMRRRIRRVFRPILAGRRNRAPGWKAVERQLTAEIGDALAKIRLESARNLAVHLADEPLPFDFDPGGDGRAAELAAEIVATSKRRWGEMPKGRKRAGKDLAEYYSRNFGPDRIDLIAATEVAIAHSKGEAAALKWIRRKTTGILVWWRNDDDPCEICQTVHNVEKRTWGRRFPSGPPIHPRCRCYLEYTRKIK